MAAFLSFDQESIYVAFVCKTADPGSIRARMGRRESIFEDDWVAVHLDPFQERQRAYMFFANPIGIQADGITSEGGGDDMSFDAVWSATGRLTADGYVVLIAIPFKSLRFPSGSNPRAWGIALERQIPTRSESSFWPGITRRVSGFSAQFGSLEGVQAVSPGRNLQLIPYGTFTGARFFDEDASVRATRRDVRGGIDAKVVLRDQFTVDATINPDFSQVESDEPQVTINQRFEVFFPEKRPFFLENSDYFETPITLFFSRRVRDPQVGGRVTGRAGRWAIGALAMDDRQPGQVIDRENRAFGEGTFNGVFRARRDFSNQSRVGFMATSRDFAGSSNNVGSIDTRVRRGIVDYDGILPNESLVALDRRKHLTADVLLTYLLHPGTALYIGYTDGYDNFRQELTPGAFHLAGAPTFSTGRQVFVKSSYLLRF